MNPLTLPWKLIAEVVAFAALCAAIAFGIHRFLEHEQDIGRNEVRAEYQAQLLKATQDAKAKDELNAKQLKEAQDALAKANDTIRSISAAAAVSSNSLRDTINAVRRGVPTASLDALRQSVDTLGGILNECQDRYRSVAEAADRANADKKALIDAWPK
jgi:methylphosphotriester-DNA--protein-cysteine methyltransferase